MFDEHKEVYLFSELLARVQLDKIQSPLKTHSENRKSKQGVLHPMRFLFFAQSLGRVQLRCEAVKNRLKIRKHDE